MTIALLCPNGHKLMCPESQAGKRGKCPHCGAIFRVPDMTASGNLSSNGSAITSDSAPAASPVPVGAAAAQVAAAPVPIAPTPAHAEPEPAESEPNPIRPFHDGEPLADGEIAFLCPNGHHLCGSTELGGEPGECPECGVKFLVPTEAELIEPAEDDHAADNPFLFDLGEPAPKAERPRRNSRGEFFERLWEYKTRGAAIELYLEGGTVLTPDGYASGLSKQNEGVFLVQESDGTYTVAVVAWDTITHMAVRGLEEVPAGVFDVP